MKIFGMNFGSTKPEPVQVTVQQPKQNIQPAIKVELEDESKQSLSSISFAIQNEYIPPTSQYYVSNGMVKWGRDNLFPLQLADLYNSSPIHQSITLQKSVLVTGKGVKYQNLSGLTPEQQTELLQFDSFANGCDKSLMDIASELSLDYQVFGAIALEVIWDLTFTKIIKINRIPVMNLRIGEENANGKIEKFYFNKDWTRMSMYGTSEIYSFNLQNKINTNQLIYIKNPSMDSRYYGVPTYSSGLNWIASDAAISKFHLSNISNGMSPSLKINFYKVPDTPEQQDEIVSKLKRDYTSQRNAGKAMILFSDGKDVAPTIEPIQVNNIDKQFTVIADQIVNQILRSHRGVSGILFGISTSGNKLSLAGEYESAFKIFEQTVISGDRKIIENLFNRILKVNGLDAGLYFEPFQVFNSQIG